MKDDFTPEQATRELHDLLVKAGRRCAYDLRHASHEIRDRELSEMFADRANHWLSIFNPGNDQKNYRHRLYTIIEELEIRIERLQERCVANNVDISDLQDNDIPF